jgi:hypothetical protein
MRYLIAIITACLLIAGGWFFVGQTNRHMAERFEVYKADLKARKQAGQLPPELRDLDIDRLEMSQVSLRLNQQEQVCRNIALVLDEYAYLLMALSVAVCFAVAVAVGWLRGKKV